MSGTVYVSSNPILSRTHTLDFIGIFCGQERIFNSIEQFYSFMRYFTPVHSETNKKAVSKVLNEIMNQNTGAKVKDYVKSIQPKYRNKEARGPGGNPAWESIQKEGHVQNKFLFLFDATYQKILANSKAKKALIETGTAEIHDDSKENYEHSINFGTILMAVRTKILESNKEVSEC